MKIIETIKNIFQVKFPKIIKGVYVYYEFGNKESKYCVKLWKDVNWGVGDIVPMFKKDGEIAFYEITSAYYTSGDSMSDWALGDDGKNRDFKLHHII